MACRSCRQQLRLLGRHQSHVLAPAVAPEMRNGYIISGRRRALEAQNSQQPIHQQRRNFSTTGRQEGKIWSSVKDILLKGVSSSAEPYRVVNATEQMYKACAKEATYTISKADVKADTIKKTEEGEHIGEGGGMWHDDFNLPPTFSTWSQVTMLHMYVLFARLRNLERETARGWQKQLVDHFFFDAEERMGNLHGITARGLQHRYLKDLFVQWRGCVAAYDEGVAKGDAVLAAAVWRNLFKADEQVDARVLASIVSWMRLTLKMLDQMPDEALYFQGAEALKWPAKNEMTVVDHPCRQMLPDMTAAGMVAVKAKPNASSGGTVRKAAA